MISKNLIIYEYQTLFDILNEISEKLDFSVLKSNEKDLSLLKEDELGNFIIIAKKSNKKLEQALNCYRYIDNPNSKSTYKDAIESMV